MDAYQVMTSTIDHIAPRTVSSVLLTVVGVLIVCSLAAFKWKRRHLEKLGSQLPGPRAFPIIGNGLEFIGDPEEILTKIVQICEQYDESPFRIWLGPVLCVVISTPEDLQIVLNSSKALAKDPLYRFFRNTVGTGLFSAPVEKWRRNRKIITPAFNTRLLEQFIPVFNEQNHILVKKLTAKLGTGLFDVWDFISPATLDIICPLVYCDNIQSLILKQVCDTKWEVRINSVSAVLHQYDSILRTLDELGETMTDSTISSEVKSLQMHIMGRFFILGMLETALGANVGAQDDPHSEFALALPRASELDYMRIFKFWLHPDFIFERVSYAQELKQIYKQLHGLPNKIIKEKKEAYRLKKEAKLRDPKSVEDVEYNIGDTKKLKVFLDILLELSDAGANFSDDDLRDEVVTMMVGGSETSALTNCFCILLLAIHEDIQVKVYEEVYRIFGDSDRGVTMEDLSEMTYLEMVLKETLRLYPVGPLFLRQVQEDLQLTTCTLPAGCSVVLTPFKLHKRAEFYPNPHLFNPEHFLPEVVANRHRYSYIPFSGGPRGCIGSKYAFLSMKATISTLLRSYHFSTDVKLEDIKLRIDLLLRSANGFNVRVEPRKTNLKP